MYFTPLIFSNILLKKEAYAPFLRITINCVMENRLNISFMLKRKVTIYIHYVKPVSQKYSGLLCPDTGIDCLVDFQL